MLVVSCSSPPPAPPAAPQTSPQPSSKTAFVVSPERKQASLVEIRALVDKLNGIIDRRAFDDWLPYLDDAYLNTYSDPQRLKDYSTNSPFLIQYNIKLTSLLDYFQFVVVPSRAKVTVDDITFVDENRVEVWTVIDNERFLLYLLKLYGKEWKISSW